VSTKTLPVTFAGAGTQNLPGGRFLYIKQASAALDITLRDANGTPNYITGAGAGMKFKRLDGAPWRFTDITSAAAQNVVVVLSDDAEVDIASTVTVAGAVTVATLPATVVAGSAPVINNATQAALFAANLARKRISFSLVSTAVTGAAVFARAAGSGVNLYEIQPGVIYTEEGTFGLDVRNDSGGNLTFMVAEYS
jgi:hypothetical protein